MADTPSPVFINLISDDSDFEDAAENTAEDVDMDGLSESGGPPDGSDSEGSIIIPPVPAAQGSEDDETDVDSDARNPGIPRRPTPDIRRDVSIPASGELNMPRIELDPYVMNHSHFSDGFKFAPPLHSAFSKAGLHNSAHFKQWLDHFYTDESRAPPYAEHLSDKDAVIFSQLDVNVQREARNLRVLSDLASAVEGDILELERLEYIVTRMANGPVMRAAAAAQGADLQIPGWLRERAAATPPLLARAGDSTSSVVNNRQPNTREAGGTRAPKAGPSNTRVTAASGSQTSVVSGKRSTSRALVKPVTFPIVSGVLEESLVASGSGRGNVSKRNAAHQTAGPSQRASAGAGQSSRGTQSGQAGRSSAVSRRTGSHTGVVRRRADSTSSDEAARPRSKKRY